MSCSCCCTFYITHLFSTAGSSRIHVSDHKLLLFTISSSNQQVSGYSFRCLELRILVFVLQGNFSYLVFLDQVDDILSILSSLQSFDHGSRSCFLPKVCPPTVNEMTSLENAVIEGTKLTQPADPWGLTLAYIKVQASTRK